MRWTKLFKPAGAIATTACAVVTGIAVNLSILSSGPDGAGNLSLNAHRATTTIAPLTQSTHGTKPNSAARVVIHIASVPPAQAVIVPDGAGSSPQVPPLGSTTAPSTTNPPPVTTTTTAPPLGSHTFAVGHAGTVATQWIDANTIVVTAHAAPGWTVHLRERANLIEARFDHPGSRIVWRALVANHSLTVSVHHYSGSAPAPDPETAAATVPKRTTSTTAAQPVPSDTRP